MYRKLNLLIQSSFTWTLPVRLLMLFFTIGQVDRFEFSASLARNRLEVGLEMFLRYGLGWQGPLFNSFLFFYIHPCTKEMIEDPTLFPSTGLVLTSVLRKLPCYLANRCPFNTCMLIDALFCWNIFLAFEPRIDPPKKAFGVYTYISNSGLLL